MSVQHLHQTTNNSTHGSGTTNYIINQAISRVQQQTFLLTLGLQIHVQQHDINLKTEVNYDLQVKAKKIELIKKALRQILHIIPPAYQYDQLIKITQRGQAKISASASSSKHR